MANATLLSTFVVLTQTIAMAQNPDIAPKIEVQNDNYVKRKGGVITLTVHPDAEIGPVKRMNAVNNGPNCSLDPNRRREPGIGRFVSYRDARFPLARIHDARGTGSPPGHVGDINLLFPDWEADETNPKNYDFTLTDWLLHSVRNAGTEIMFRLGNSADYGPKQYGGDEVPRDPAKWARVAEHIIRHYNEGWGWTAKHISFKNQFRIKYWEIWNEPDLGCTEDYWKSRIPYWPKKRRYWNGTPEQFFDFYVAVAKHLKKTFPKVKIGGPSVAGAIEWTDRFLAHCAANSAPLDFFSWHVYSDSVAALIQKSEVMKKLLVAHGYGEAESVLDEWNWNQGWYDEAVRASAAMRTGANNFKMAAFYASVMCAMQDSSTDLLVYYDSRLPTHWNGLFDQVTQRPLKGYYAFYAWAKLRALGVQVRVDADANDAGVRATAARGEDGRVAVCVARYTANPSELKCRTVRVAIAGHSLAGAICHLTDFLNRYTEVPLAELPNGAVEIDLEPNAFAFIETRK